MENTAESEHEITIKNSNGDRNTMNQKAVSTEMKTLGVYDLLARGNKGHLDYIKKKTSTWINIMKNGHLPSNITWVAYKLQLWMGLRYRLGTMTNDIKEADALLQNEDQEVLNILGITQNITRGLQQLHSTFGGFGLFSLAMEQLISRVNILMQHYHTPTHLSRKVDASIRYLQLQLGQNKNPFHLDYDTWGHLAPLFWAKMRWRSLQYYQVRLHMKYKDIPYPR